MMVLSTFPSSLTSSFLRQKLTEHGSFTLTAANRKLIARGDKQPVTSDGVGVGNCPNT